MPLFENHVGISVSVDALRLVELVYSNNEFVLESVDELRFDENLNPLVVDETFINILQTSFQKLTSNNSLLSKNISFCLDPEFFQLLEVPFENTLLKQDLTEHFNWELSKIKPKLATDDHLIQHIELEQSKFSDKNNAAVLFLNKKLLNVFSKITQESDFQLRYIDYSHSSANIFIRYLNKSYGSSGLSVFASEKNLALMVLEDYKPVVMKTDEFSMGIELQDVLDKMIKEATVAGVKFTDLSYAYLVGVNNGELASLVKNEISSDVNLINPFDVIKVSENFSTEIDLQDNPSRFAPSAGVALRLF